MRVLRSLTRVVWLFANASLTIYRYVVWRSSRFKQRIMKRFRRSLILLSMMIVVAGCAAPTTTPAPANGPAPTSFAVGSLPIVPVKPVSLATVTQAELRQRALHLPALSAGDACPRASGRQVAPAYGPAVGDGPVYAVDLGTDGISYFSFPPSVGSLFYGSEWSGAKILWIIAPAYRGPVLIRGGRLDGSGALRFNKGLDNGVDPVSELWVDAGATSIPADWRNTSSYVRVRAPGCYAFQVDGQDFSEIIVFEAKAQS